MNGTVFYISIYFSFFWDFRFNSVKSLFYHKDNDTMLIMQSFQLNVSFTVFLITNQCTVSGPYSISETSISYLSLLGVCIATFSS